ncbi:hypothetical protein ABIC83_002466 [Roseateles asaccharophilus]|uniref:hypothetical protein n=1 Tax=Roseateles asaccharophilus TaxID=582607 RepID=UPI0038375E4E
MQVNIAITPGLPPPLTGACIFLLWDGTLCEGALFQKDGRRWLVHYNFAKTAEPERIEMPADGGKVQGYAPIAGWTDGSAPQPCKEAS